MTGRKTDSLLPSAATGITSEALGEDRKGWVHLLPTGTFGGIDGRGPYTADDLAGIIAASRQSAGRRQMVVDYEHSTDLIPSHPRARGTPVPAAGWIIGLQARGNGIWGHVEWTERAAQHIANREYRYLSPVFAHSHNGKVRAILRASLTNVPNLDQLTALASAEDETMNQQIRLDIIKLLGLDAETDDAAILEKIRSLVENSAMHSERPDPSQYVPIGDFQRVLAEANKLRSGISLQAAQTHVAEDISKGIILPWMKDWAIELCMSNMPAYEKFIDGIGAGFSHLLKRSGASASHPSLHGEDAGQDDTEATVARNLGHTAEELRNTRSRA